MVAAEGITFGVAGTALLHSNKKPSNFSMSPQGINTKALSKSFIYEHMSVFTILLSSKKVRH
jgi:hypothetical protein